MPDDTLIAVFASHEQAERAIKDLADGKFDMKHLSIVGQGYHTEEKVVGFYNTGDRIKFWGKRGAFWGGLWGLFFGGVFLMVPVVGQIMVLGYLATAVASAVEGAIVVGGLSVLGAALASIGVPKDSVLQYRDRSEGGRISGHRAWIGCGTGPRPNNSRRRGSGQRCRASRLDACSGHVKLSC